MSASLGMLWLTQLDTTPQYLTHILPAVTLMSLGLGFVFVSLAATSLFGVSPHDAGVASGLLNTTQQIGGSLGIAVMNTIAASATATYITTNGPESLQAATVHGFAVAFAVSAGVLGLAAIVSAILINADRHALAQHDVGVPAAGLPTHQFSSCLRVHPPPQKKIAQEAVMSADVRTRGRLRQHLPRWRWLYGGGGWALVLAGVANLTGLVVVLSRMRPRIYR